MAAEIIADPACGDDLGQWARRIGISERGLTRHFRAETGLSFVQWRAMVRMKAAIEMLGEGHSVTAIALALGYDSVSNFIHLFRRTFGETPARHRAKFRAVHPIAVT
jgi:AraC-like DNA-binding protein